MLEILYENRENFLNRLAALSSESLHLLKLSTQKFNPLLRDSLLNLRKVSVSCGNFECFSTLSVVCLLNGGILDEQSFRLDN